LGLSSIGKLEKLSLRSSIVEAQPALAADVARRREKWLILRFFVYGKMLAGRRRATRLKRRPLGHFSEGKRMDNCDVIYHYTTISGLIGIISGHELWASDCRFLNDGSEIIYAENIFYDEVQKIELPHLEYGNGGYRLPGPTLSIFRMFLACFCENGDLLSQWRGYAIDQGYSIGFRTTELKALAIGEVCPVQYGIPNPDEYFKEELETAKVPTAHPGVEEWHASMWIMPKLARIKHPSYSEECEWRILAQYPSYGEPLPMNAIKYRPSSLGPIPYFPIAFPPKCVCEIVIGPGNHTETRETAIREMLKNLEYSDINIRVSNIPFRK
jgi:hypothetical protein